MELPQKVAVGVREEGANRPGNVRCMFRHLGCSIPCQSQFIQVLVLESKAVIHSYLAGNGSDAFKMQCCTHVYEPGLP